MKEKILFIGRFPPPVHGAANMNEFYFNSKLLNKNFTLERIKINDSSNLEEIGKFKIKKFFRIFNVFFSLLKKLIFFKPKIIYFEIAPTNLAFLRDSIYVILCKIFRKKIIFQIHARGIEQKVKKKLWKDYYKFIFKNNKIILLSKMLYSEVKEIIKKEDIHFLPNGIEDKLNKKEFERILNQRKINNIPSILFISNMIEEKGAIDALKICSILKEKNKKFICNFVGPWQEKNFRKKWEKTRKELKLEKDCIYLGSKYNNEKEEIFNKTNFLLFPTKYKNESFPLVILEAYMHGIPVFSYSQGAIKEMIPKKFLGYASEKRDWRELSLELIKNLNSQVKSHEIRKFFKENYTIEKSEIKLNEIFIKEIK
ncbi:MAG: glycosyltransferase family 4 protein [Candidatus Pacearchaeota archaeon]|jgi:glycosyltransferase involved in cell wall biosynthesis